jgi:hypothetical protein
VSASVFARSIFSVPGQVTRREKRMDANGLIAKICSVKHGITRTEIKYFPLEYGVHVIERVNISS